MLAEFVYVHYLQVLIIFVHYCDNRPLFPKISNEWFQKVLFTGFDRILYSFDILSAIQWTRQTLSQQNVSFDFVRDNSCFVCRADRPFVIQRNTVFAKLDNAIVEF